MRASRWRSHHSAAAAPGLVGNPQQARLPLEVGEAFEGLPHRTVATRQVKQHQGVDGKGVVQPGQPGGRGRRLDPGRPDNGTLFLEGELEGSGRQVPTRAVDALVPGLGGTVEPEPQLQISAVPFGQHRLRYARVMHLRPDIRIGSEEESADGEVGPGPAEPVALEADDPAKGQGARQVRAKAGENLGDGGSVDRAGSRTLKFRRRDQEQALGRFRPGVRLDEGDEGRKRHLEFEAPEAVPVDPAWPALLAEATEGGTESEAGKKRA